MPQIKPSGFVLSLSTEEMKSLAAASLYLVTEVNPTDLHRYGVDTRVLELCVANMMREGIVAWNETSTALRVAA